MRRVACGTRESNEEYLCELISSQVHFGLTYVGQARSAYENGKGEHGEIARTIAVNAYSTANRFASRLTERTRDARLNGIEALRVQIESVWPNTTFAREIAS
ncbi:MAG: hypothetical protein JO033_18915 [Acidobacteriaceae bacterium]|nr:hypothetical protein [Acidobacteriaceae bacterium]MBV9503193.1 hypothetical protein [Acidobacteriaceae bacterium]